MLGLKLLYFFLFCFSYGYNITQMSLKKEPNGICQGYNMETYQSYSKIQCAGLCVNRGECVGFCSNQAKSSCVLYVLPQTGASSFIKNYVYYNYFAATVNSLEADAACQALGYFLFLPLNAAQNNVLNRMPDQVFLGMTNHGVLGNWTRMIDAANIAFFNWIPGQPDNYLGIEFCAEGFPSAQWNDLPCSLQKSTVLCQFPAPTCNNLPSGTGNKMGEICYSIV